MRSGGISPMRYAFAVFAAAFLLIAARPALAADPSPGSKPAFGRLSGELVRVRGGGRDLAVRDASGKRHRITVPPEIRVHRLIGIAEIGTGEPVHVQFKSFDGSEEVYLLKVERRNPGSPATDHDPKIPKPPRRFWGRLVSADAKSRQVTIRHPDGEIRSFTVRSPAFVYALATPADLERGDSVRIVFRVRGEDPQPVTVKAISAAALEELKEGAGGE